MIRKYLFSNFNLKCLKPILDTICPMIVQNVNKLALLRQFFTSNIHQTNINIFLHCHPQKSIPKQWKTIFHRHVDSLQSQVLSPLIHALNSISALLATFFQPCSCLGIFRVFSPSPHHPIGPSLSLTYVYLGVLSVSVHNHRMVAHVDEVWNSPPPGRHPAYHHHPHLLSQVSVYWCSSAGPGMGETERGLVKSVLVCERPTTAKTRDSCSSSSSSVSSSQTPTSRATHRHHQSPHFVRKPPPRTTHPTPAGGKSLARRAGTCGRLLLFGFIMWRV